MADLVPGTVACPRCGEARPEGARFCMRCGLSLADESPSRRSAPLELVPPVAPGVLPPAAPSPSSSLTLATPSIVGHPASRIGWAGTFIGAALFLAATVAVLGAAGSPDPVTPTAHWDPTLQNPDAISAGQPFDVAVEAANPGADATDRLWLVIDWRPSGVGTGTAGGRLVACLPADCEFRSDPSAGVTVIVWTGLPAGTHRTFRATLAVDGVTAGQALTFRVTAGTGAAESRLRDSVRWTRKVVVQ